jgi:hypothetical protein
MKKFLKVMLATVLVLSLFAPVSAFAHGGGKGKLKSHGKPHMGQMKKPEVKPGKPAPKHAPKHAPKFTPHHGPKGGSMFGGKGKMPIMKQTLFTLLAEKYSPDTLAAWEATIATGEKTRADIQAIVKANPELRKSLKPQHTEDLKAKMEAHKETRAAFEAALKAKDAEKIKASLATILARLQDRNKLMASKLTALQKAVAEKTAATTPTTPETPVQ